jgi:acetyl-CoA carboxylase carboxyl transferase subunit alpha
LIDKIVPEPNGGAHRDPLATAQTLKKQLTDALRLVADLPTKDLLETRYERLQSYGRFTA